MRRGVRQHQGAPGAPRDDGREWKKKRDEKWHPLGVLDVTLKSRTAHVAAQKKLNALSIPINDEIITESSESEKTPNIQIKAELSSSTGENVGMPAAAPALTSSLDELAALVMTPLEMKPEPLPVIENSGSTADLPETESWSSSDSEAKVISSKIEDAALSAPASAPAPPSTPSSPMQPSLTNTMLAHALQPISELPPLVSLAISHPLSYLSSVFPPTSLRLTPELTSSLLPSAFSPFSHNSLPSFARRQPQLVPFVPPPQSQCMASKFARDLREEAIFFDKIAARPELTTEEGLGCRMKLLEQLEALAARFVDEAQALRSSLEAKGIALPPSKHMLSARKRRRRPPKLKKAAPLPHSVPVTQAQQQCNMPAACLSPPAAIPRAPRPLVDTDIVSLKARRPLKDASHLTRVRTSPTAYISMRTVQEIGPVHLQVPIDPAMLPQATTTLRGKIFEYHWQYEGVTAKEVVDAQGQRWVHVFARTDNTIPSIVVAVQAVSTAQLATLEAQSEPMLRKLKVLERDPLRYTQSVILGYWRPYRCLLAPSKPSLGFTERSWLKQQQPLFEHVSSLLQRSLPAVHEELRRQTEKLYPPFKLGVYPTMAFNQTICTEHVDVRDFADLRCGVLAFGKWKNGGALLMPELGVRLALQPGDVVFFPSALYLHENEPLQEGETRRSLVFFAHTDVISETTLYPSAEDIVALADGREPSWKIEARREREMMKETAKRALAAANMGGRSEPSNPQGEARDLARVLASEKELAAEPIASLTR